MRYLTKCRACGSKTRNGLCSSCRQVRRVQRARDSATGAHARRLARQERAGRR